MSKPDILTTEHTIAFLSDVGFEALKSSATCPLDKHGEHPAVELIHSTEGLNLRFIRCDGDLWLTTGSTFGYRLLGKASTDLRDDVVLIRNVMDNPLSEYELAPALTEINSAIELKEIRDCFDVLKKKYGISTTESIHSCPVPGHTLWDSNHQSLTFEFEANDLGTATLVFYKCGSTLCFDLIKPNGDLKTDIRPAEKWSSPKSSAKIIASFIDKTLAYWRAIA
jgi:hypothetical protein